jgi:glycerate 2-kinase
VDADPRRLLLELYAAGCDAVEGRRRVRAALAGIPGRDPVFVLAIGKAATAMSLGAWDALGPRLERGLVVSRPGHHGEELEAAGVFLAVEGGHPLPDASSLAAGTAVLSFARGIPAGARSLCLISGGASALVEALPESLGLDALQRVNSWGLAAGLDIGALNAVRRRLSLIKDGRLARALAHTEASALLISDTPDDHPATIGSGLVARAEHAPLPPLPGWLAALLPQTLPEGTTMPARVIAAIGDAVAAVERAGEERGLAVRRMPARAAGLASVAAARFSHVLAAGDGELLVWGGETTVELPPVPGRGGRNQHFALCCAERIAGHAELFVLAAGTDGTDGNTQDAGALVSGATSAAALDAGYDLAAAITACDSGTVLEALGELVHTGPTGTNVGDLMLGLRAPAGELG